ncbi:MAG TPA: glycosyltransferase family 2 protein [Candidatus Omnitrophica bacterium]|nr:glycosyltransferase family 2 protein [Candidatus Omnitrophota bacterium]
MKPLVIIPVHNEERLLPAVLESILKLDFFDVLVVDDGSTDNTLDLVSKFPVAVLENKTNVGKGAALRQGFNYALSNGYSDIITADGDGQHRAEDLLAVYNASLDGSADIVIGNRMHNPIGMPKIRVLTNRFISSVLSSIANTDIPDTQCGLKLIKSNVIKDLNISTDKFEVESEILLNTINKGYNIRSVDITSVYIEGRKSHIRPFRDTLRFLVYILRNLFNR